MEKGKRTRGRPARDLEEEDPERAERAERAQRIRMASGAASQVEFAKKLGVSPQRWNNCERGLPIGRDMQSKLIARVHGLTRDYIEDGNTGGLSGEFLRRLNEITVPPPPASAGHQNTQKSRR